MKKKPESVKITVEIIPTHWDHLSEEDVARWVQEVLINAIISGKHAIVVSGHEIADVKDIKIPQAKRKSDHIKLLLKANRNKALDTLSANIIEYIDNNF